MMKEYITVSKNCTDEFTEKKSRFIGHLYPAETADDAASVLAALKKEFWDATHNCSAYIIGSGMELMRFSDDGEPQGTAGVPMLEALKMSGITNVIAVATRYFGGTLLGAGGLVRAYSRSVSCVVQLAREKGFVIKRIPVGVYSFELPYTWYGKFENIMSSGRYYRGDTVFADKVSVSAEVPFPAEAVFIREITETFSGNVIPERAKEKYISIPL